MEKFDGSSAVSSVRTACLIFAWLLLIVGVIMIVVAVALGHNVTTGISCVGGGICLFFTAAFARGFEKVVRASETYLNNINKPE